MQSLRLLHDLSAYSTAPDSRSPRTLRKCVTGDGEEEGFPIDVKIYPSTSVNLAETEVEAEKENVEASGMEIVNHVNEEVHIEQERVEQQNSDEPMELEDSKDVFKREDIDEDELDEDEDIDDEEVYEYTPEELARFKRRSLFPTETINEVLMFLSFADCNRAYTTNWMMHELLEPRRKVCMEVFIKRLDETRERLDQTIKENLKEVNERRQHVNQLSEHIGNINVRLAEMGDHLADLDAQIVNNHVKLNELHERIERMKKPMGSWEK